MQKIYSERERGREKDSEHTRWHIKHTFVSGVANARTFIWIKCDCVLNKWIGSSFHLSGMHVRIGITHVYCMMYAWGGKVYQNIQFMYVVMLLVDTPLLVSAERSRDNAWASSLLIFRNQNLCRTHLGGSQVPELPGQRLSLMPVFQWTWVSDNFLRVPMNNSLL